MKFGMFHLSKHRRPFYFTPEHNCWWFTNFAWIFYSFILIHQKILTILLFVFWPRYAYHVLHGYIFKCIHLNASWINTVKNYYWKHLHFFHFQLKNVWNMSEKDGEGAWKKENKHSSGKYNCHLAFTTVLNAGFSVFISIRKIGIRSVFRFSIKCRKGNAKKTYTHTHKIDYLWNVEKLSQFDLLPLKIHYFSEFIW